MATLSNSRKHHAKKSPPKRAQRSLAEKRQLGSKTEAGAARSQRGGGARKKR